jgi:hypothetical protein
MKTCTSERRRSPNPRQRRALELLAASPDGCTEATMVAHGFTIKMMVDLVCDGLASAHVERVVAGNHTIEVACAKITDAGRMALARPTALAVDGGVEGEEDLGTGTEVPGSESPSERCRRFARECMEMANTFPVGEPRTTLVEMAQVWRRLAADYADGTKIERPRTATL